MTFLIFSSWARPSVLAEKEEPLVRAEDGGETVAVAEVDEGNWIFAVEEGESMTLTAEEEEGLATTAEEEEILTLAEEPEPAGPQPEQVVGTGSLLCYGSSSERGFLVSFDGGETWEERNEGLPRKVLAGTGQVRTLTAIGVDPVQPQRVAVATSKEIYLSEDYGATWRRIPFNNGSVITAVALSPVNREQLLVGTSFAGFYETTNAGQTWKKLSTNLSFLRQSPYEEEIAALAYHPENPDKLILACGFGNGLYLYNKTLNIWEKLETGHLTRQLVKNLSFQPAAVEEGFPTGETGWWLRVTYESGTEIYSWPDFVRQDLVAAPPRPAMEPAKEARLAKAAHKYGIYVRSDKASGQNLEKHLRFLKANGLNAMVVDFKDDLGYITYDTQVSLARQIGAVRKRFDIKELIKKAKANGIYLIGRLVVFKDSRLYAYNNYKYAIWDRDGDGPWRYLVETKAATGEITYEQREHWVDPYATDVWEYNLAIAAELEALGVDEIQFDYIRFPTDGPIGRCRYRYQPSGATAVDALEGFLAMARNRLQIPISTDLYGFHCWYQMEGLTGQNIRVFARYVDVICPMYYPSHFPSSFYAGDYLERAYYIYREGSFRAYALTGGECIIRPYVQAFLLGRELRMTAPVYTEYLLKQVTGTLASPAAGFTLWNNSNNYYMVKEPLAGYLTRPGQ